VAAEPINALRPSEHAFRFRNTFGDQPIWRVGPVRLGHAGNGMCGGMVFGVVDYLEAERPPPPDAQPPAQGSPLFTYLLRRLIAAFNLPDGIVRYWRWMARSDAALLDQVRHRSWAQVRARLDAGRPCPLGVVTVRGRNPALLRHNHVVLAYAYSTDGPETDPAVTVRVYDPNSGPVDDIAIHFDSSTINSSINIGHDIRGFFPLRYRARRPPLVA
jgi:hypothetical protein